MYDEKPKQMTTAEIVSEPTYQAVSEQLATLMDFSDSVI